MRLSASRIRSINRALAGDKSSFYNVGHQAIPETPRPVVHSSIVFVPASRF